MAKTVKFKNVDKVLKNLQKTFESLRENRTLQNQMGDLVVKRIQFQARAGRPMRGIGASDGSFPSLTDLSIAIRKLLEPFVKGA